MRGKNKRNLNKDQPDDRKQRKKKHKSLEEWQEIVRERIEEAMERGDFDNLPGEGKPLNFDKNPNEPHDVRMAHKILKNNNLAPVWIMERQSLLAESEVIRDEIARKWRWYNDEFAANETEAMRDIISQEWTEWLALFEQQIDDLNGRILELNITLPIWRMELMRLNLDRELARVGGRRSLEPDT